MDTNLGRDGFTFGHGYYVVRNNPDPAVEHSVARQEEEEFFNAAPWSTDFAPYQDRFGTRNLQTALSKLLFQQIQGCLPVIVDKINEKAAHIDDELSTLSAPPSANVPYILCGKLHTLKDIIRCQIEGGSREYPLQKLWTNIAEDFKRSLTKTRPTVRLLSESDKESISHGRNDDSECELTEINQPPKKLKLNGYESSPRGRPTKQSTGYLTPHFDRFTSSAKEFSWEESRDINRESASAGIPQQINPKAIDAMNQMSVMYWQEPMVAFIDASHRLVKEALLRELKEVFAQYHQTELYRELRRIIETYLEKLRKEHGAHVQEIFNIEHQRPFTMAKSALDQETNAAHDLFVGRRFEARANHFLDLQQKYIRGDPRRTNEMKKLGVDELGVDLFTLEVKMMAVRR
jgi:hypothetical protein